MKLQLWSPLRELSPMQQEVETLWDRFLASPFFDIKPHQLVPAMDVSENENEIRLTVELPGVDKENVSLSIQDGSLLIQGEKKQEKEEKNEMCYCSERTYGSFSRVMNVGPTVDAEKISARFKNGVLEVVLPKKEEAKPKSVKVDIK